MRNPSGTTHSHSIPGDKIETQMAMLDSIKKDLGFTDDKKKSLFVNHDYHPVTEKTIKAPTKSGGYVMVSHFIIDGYTHYREKCSNPSCGKVRMACK